MNKTICALLVSVFVTAAYGAPSTIMRNNRGGYTLTTTSDGYVVIDDSKVSVDVDNLSSALDMVARDHGREIVLGYDDEWVLWKYSDQPDSAFRRLVRKGTRGAATPHTHPGWYMTGRVELSFLNWDNKYSTDDGWDPNKEFAQDSYSFEPVMGGSLSIGYMFRNAYRAELEAGYIGAFEDSDATTRFEMQGTYMMANGLYDIKNTGFYVGAGLGVSSLITKWSGVYNVDSKRDYNFGLIGALMAGYTHQLDEKMYLDLRYRISGMTGGTQKFNFQDTLNNMHEMQNKMNFVLDNSISLGIRYEF
ncbi:MAG: porin family protein [Alphaproteobacteria bacterium]|nr:porin family protein [Alphaproteobacteria bacterium]